MADVLIEVPLADLPADIRGLLDAGVALPPDVVVLPENVSLIDTLVVFVGGPLVVLAAAGALKQCVDLTRLQKNVVLEGVGALLLIAAVCVGAAYVADAWRARQAADADGARFGILLSPKALVVNPIHGKPSVVPRASITAASQVTERSPRHTTQRLVLHVTDRGEWRIPILLRVSVGEAATRIEAWRTRGVSPPAPP